MPYVFYDTETTGTETAFDQILQFGAIRTDDSFNEVETLNQRCRLSPHVVPSPVALLVTGVSAEQLSNQNQSHYDFIRSVQTTLREWGPACFIGYNSVNFDEQILRQSLYKTLGDVFLTNTQGNTRGDIMRMVHAAAVYAPNALAIPISDTGKQVFKLDQLAPANGIDHGQAHDALADVRATIEIARLLRDRAPEVWERCLRATNPNAAKDMLQEEAYVSVNDNFFGKNYTWLVTYAGTNPDYDKQVAVFDLAYRPEDYLDLDVPDLINVMNRTPKAIRTVKTNAQPTIMPAGMHPDTGGASRFSPEELSRRARVIAEAPDFQRRVGEALAQRFPEEEASEHVEKRIYDGFPTPADKERMTRFHQADWPKRMEIAQEIEDPRYQELALRLIHAERPEALPEDLRFQYDEWLSRRLTTQEDVPWRTLHEALREADDRLESASGADREHLLSIRRFLEQMANQHEPA